MKKYPSVILTCLCCFPLSALDDVCISRTEESEEGNYSPKFEEIIFLNSILFFTDLYPIIIKLCTPLVL